MMRKNGSRSCPDDMGTLKCYSSQVPRRQDHRPAAKKKDNRPAHWKHHQVKAKKAAMPLKAVKATQLRNDKKKKTTVRKMPTGTSPMLKTRVAQ